MKEFVEKLSLGVCEYKSPSIKTSVTEIELVLNSKSAYSGEFTIYAEDDMTIKGVVYSTHEKFRLINNTFYGKEITIKYEIDLAYIDKGEELVGNINIVSNGGEIIIPFHIEIDSPSADTTIGKVKNLFHFANLAQTSYDEAVSLFKSQKFPEIFLKDNLYLESVYEGLICSRDIHLALEEFLIAASKKTPIDIALQENKKSYSELDKNYGDTVVITKNNWGYVDVEVEVDGDFITGCKKRFSTHDFVGSSYEYSFLIDVKRLHQGNNFGTITFIAGNKRHTLDILVKEKTTYTKTVKEYQSYIQQLLRMYIDFRLRKIAPDKWASMSLAIIERMRNVKDDSYFVKLIQAQIEISQGRESDGAWILENVAESLIANKEDNMEMYCYYLYVRTLQKRDMDFTKEVIRKVKEYFESGYDCWQLLWILMYLDEDFDSNKSLKLVRIKEQFMKGMTSPIMYYEAMHVFNEQPELLRVLNDFEIQILVFGSKEGFISDKLANQISEVVLTLKHFNPLIFKLLTTIYAKNNKLSVLNAIISMLIKGNKTETRYFEWYDEAIKKEIKLTGLYEYYVYSLPEDFSGDIPKIILMYFAYNTSVASDKLAKLYKDVIKEKDDNKSVYDSYSRQMSYFVADCILRGVINEDIAFVFKDVLKSAMVTPEMASKLPAVLNTHVIKCDNENIRRVIVLHKEMQDVEIVPLIDGRAYATIYTSNPAIIFEDMNGNRYCDSLEYTMDKIVDMEDYLKICYEITAEDLGLTLYFADKYINFHQNGEKSVGILKCIVADKRVRYNYRLMIENEIINYYSENYDGDVVDEFLQNIDDTKLTSKTIKRLAELFIIRGIYDKAWEYIKKYGYSFLEPRRVLKCVNKLILEKDFVEDKLLLDVSIFLFRKGKYNENILRYLSNYYYGSTEEMYNIWARCADYDFVDREMCEKLLAQMMFARSYLNKADKVYTAYYKIGAAVKIKKAFLFFKAFEYFVREVIVNDEIFDCIFNEIEADNPIPELCKLALVKYCADKENPGWDRIPVCKQIIESMCRKNKMFGFFKKYERFFKLPNNLIDKTFVEYHTDTDSKVLIHYQIEEGDHDKKEYQVVEMNNIYNGIFIKEFVLFYGEKIKYYITEEKYGDYKINESKSITREEDGLASNSSRFGMLNDMLVCADMKEEATLKDMTMQYTAALELNQSIFSVM